MVFLLRRAAKMAASFLVIIAAAVGQVALPTIDRLVMDDAGEARVLSLKGHFGEADAGSRAFQAPLASHGYGTLGGQAGGYSAGERASRVSAACLLGSLLPGAGHVASNTYLYRGLAFTLSFLLAVAAGSTFFWLEEAGVGGGYSVTGGWVLMIGAQVIYVWSLVDAISLASSSGPRIH